MTSSIGVTAAYEQMLETPSDIRGHLARFVTLVEQLDAQRVCELGVRTGVSTIAWLEGLRRTGGQLFAVDLDPCPIQHRQLTFIRGDDCDPDVVAQIPDELDIVFIDSSHLHGHTVKEIELYLPKLSLGGCMVFHDTAVERFDHHPDDERPFPVRTAVDQAVFEGGWQVDWFDDSYGLAICWPPAEGDE